MSVQTVHSAVTYHADGVRQLFHFVDPDGNPIPLEFPEDLNVRIDDHYLHYKADFMISTDDGKPLVTMFTPPPRGVEVHLERNTLLTQMLKFRRQGDWTIDGVEKGMDRIIMAVQDTVRRVAQIEKVVSVEHRVVEVPLGENKADPELVLAITKELERAQPQGLVEADISKLSEIIALVVVQEMRDQMQPFGVRLAALEAKMHALGVATSEEVA